MRSGVLLFYRYDVNLSAFRTRFPEFDLASDGLVQSHIDGAALRIDRTWWDTLADEGHGYLAAHMLASSPWGQSAKLVTEKGETTYGEMYKSLRRGIPRTIAI